MVKFQPSFAWQWLQKSIASVRESHKRRRARAALPESQRQEELRRILTEGSLEELRAWLLESRP